MLMRVACKIDLIGDERVILTRWSRGRRTPARLVLRAKIVLAAAIVNLMVLFTALAVNVSLAAFG